LTRRAEKIAPSLFRTAGFPTNIRTREFPEYSAIILISISSDSISDILKVEVKMNTQCLPKEPSISYNTKYNEAVAGNL